MISLKTLQMEKVRFHTLLTSEGIRRARKRLERKTQKAFRQFDRAKRKARQESHKTVLD